MGSSFCSHHPLASCCRSPSGAPWGPLSFACLLHSRTQLLLCWPQTGQEGHGHTAEATHQAAHTEVLQDGVSLRGQLQDTWESATWESGGDTAPRRALKGGCKCQTLTLFLLLPLGAWAREWPLPGREGFSAPCRVQWEGALFPVLLCPPPVCVLDRTNINHCKPT